MGLINTLGLPQPFVDAATSDYIHTERRYSVTSLLNGVRQNVLTRRHGEEIEQDVADMVWLIFGKAVHSILENSKESDTQLKENWVSADMPNGYVLSGIFDLYDDATGTVTDYKTASIWKAVFGEYDDYRTQLLGYCWILRQMGFDAHRGEIVMLLKDHSKTKAKREADYPPHPVKIVSWDFAERDFDDFGMWVQHRFEEIEAAEQLPDDQLPLCTPEERWHKPDKWAVRKRGVKKAMRLLDSELEAQAYKAHQEAKGAKGIEIEFREGTDSKCMDYCPVCEFCDHYKAIVKAGEAA